MTHAIVNDENSYNVRHVKSINLSSDDVPVNLQLEVPTRVYLGNISNYHPVAPPSLSSSIPSSAVSVDTLVVCTATMNADSDPEHADNASMLSKRRSLKSDRVPLSLAQQQPNKLHQLSNTSKPIRKQLAVPETEPKHVVPSRLPQKRQATESSTDLVEKIHARHESTASIATTSSFNSAIGYKKTRLVDYEWQDLDEEDADDPLMASEYVSDIFTYMYELEQRMLPDPLYLQKQKHLKPKMRSILVDWLVEMHLRFRLLPESLFLSLNIMDRFMSVEVVQIDKLQLLATGSLFIAAKYEEVFSPSVKNYAYFTEGSYSEDEILQAEKYILTVLNFDLNYPNPMNFLRRISKADDYDVQSRTLGKYLLELTAVDFNFIGIRPLLCCAAAMYMARLILNKLPVWNGNLIHYSGGYRVTDFSHCAELLLQYLVSPVEHDEFFKKYATRKFMKASILCRSWAKKFVALGKNLLDQSLSTHRISFRDSDSPDA